jgi:hypothetical protein
MKTTDLRIGNLVLSKGVPVQIEEIMWETVRYCFGEFPIHYVEPIPLTEQWLLKFGYFDLNERCGLKGIFGIIGKKATINIETMSYCQIDYEGSIFDIIKIHYVHQLQNLYFAFNGEELTQIENL